MFLKLTFSQKYTSVGIIYMLCYGEPFAQKHEGELSKKLVCFSNAKKVARNNSTQSATTALQLKYFL